MLAKIKNKLAFLLILLIIIIGLNNKTSQFIGINYEVSEYEIPIYLKIYNFYGRHINYEYLISKIIKNNDNDKDKVIKLSKWVNSNIKKITKDIDVVDSHPLTIVERRLGTEDQFSDLLSVLLVYANIDSFMAISINGKSRNVLTFFNLNGNWALVDPYYGIIFLNLKREIASINEIKSEDWEIFTLDMEVVDMRNFRSIFNNEFDSIKQVKSHYKKQFNQAPTQDMISMTSLFELDGRSYIQSPLGRFKFILSSI